LFICVLSALSAAFAFFLPLPLRTKSLISQGIITVLFLVLLLTTSNPFLPLPFHISEGQSLNPLLQDKGLLLHPPLLYLGYVGFSAPFSIALSLLWEGKERSLKILRPWVLLPWGLLTAGITFGSWWAYYELGWGGWWFWDPVENISLMPWLAATALLHILLTDKFHKWTLFLCLLTFGLSLLGTFLVRSGLIISVHSFAVDPEKGIVMASLIALIMAAAFAIWMLKAPKFSSPPVQLVSQKGLILGNSLILSIVLATLLLGTLYPLLNEILGGSPLSIGAPYFENTLVPLSLPLFILLPIGCLFCTQRMDLFSLLLIPLTAVLGALVLLLYYVHPPSLLSITGISLAIWVISGTLLAFYKKRLSLGAFCAHLGVGVSLLGVSVGGGFRVDEARPLKIHHSLPLAGLPLTLESVFHGNEPTYIYERAILSYSKRQLAPEKRLYRPQQSFISETAITTNGFRDIYVALGPYQGEDTWLVRASWIPLAPWIWLGGALMVLGAGLSLFRRLPRP
jgi:cytochrome c-type biogenesis protein CcmF